MLYQIALKLFLRHILCYVIVDYNSHRTIDLETWWTKHFSWLLWDLISIGLNLTARSRNAPLVIASILYRQTLKVIPKARLAHHLFVPRCLQKRDGRSQLLLFSRRGRVHKMTVRNVATS